MPDTTPEWDAQVFCRSLLLQHTALAAAVSHRIYDGAAPTVPQSDLQVNNGFPYIILDSWTGVPRDIQARYGADVTFVVHVFSAYNGTREVNQLGAYINQALHQPVSQGTLQSGWYVELCRIVQTDLLRELGERGEVPIQHMIKRVRLYLKAKGANE